MDEIVKIILAIIPSAVAGGFGVYLFQKEKRKNIEHQLSEKRFQVYSEYIKLIYDIQKTYKNNKPLKEDYKTDTIYFIKTNLIIYGNDKVVKAFFEWEKFSATEKDPEKIFFYVGKVFEEIRKDMGNKRTIINAKKLGENFLGYRQQ